MVKDHEFFLLYMYLYPNGILTWSVRKFESLVYDATLNAL